MLDPRYKHEYLDRFPKPMSIFKQFEHGIMIGTIEFTSSDLQSVLWRYHFYIMHHTEYQISIYLSLRLYALFCTLDSSDSSWK